MYILTYHRDTDTYYEPTVQSDVTLELCRKDNPGKLEFTVAPPLNGVQAIISEGDTVRVWMTQPENTAETRGIFFGFCFKLDYSPDGSIKVTAYDQLRYLKNRDTLTYENKTADEVLKLIAADRKDCLQIGSDIADTKKVIASRVEENQTYFDMIMNALDLTLAAGGDMYVLYDDFGELALKCADDLQTNLLIDSQTAGSYSKTSSIDGDTYNAVRLVKGDSDDEGREVYDYTPDDGNVGKWGLLRYYDSVDDDVDMQERAKLIIERYNRPEKSLSVKGVLGDARIRGGSLVYVTPDFNGKRTGTEAMMVEKVKHTFSDNSHTMDLTLSGGDYSA